MLLIDYTSHEAWLNSEPLRQTNITIDAPDTLPGTTYWRRDAAGSPTGVDIEFRRLDVYISLEIGKYADIVVLENDLCEVNISQIKDVKVFSR